MSCMALTQPFQLSHVRQSCQHLIASSLMNETSDCDFLEQAPCGHVHLLSLTRVHDIMASHTADPSFTT